MTQTIDRPEAITPAQSPDTLVVTVLPKHIAAGQRLFSNLCAVALALTDDGWVLPIVGTDGVLVYKPGSSLGRNFEATPDFADWIHRFDAGEPVEPERFVLHALR